jgi:hypothetical protein
MFDSIAEKGAGFEWPNNVKAQHHHGKENEKVREASGEFLNNLRRTVIFTVIFEPDHHFNGNLRAGPSF